MSYIIGPILVAVGITVPSYHFVLDANAVVSLGDIATQVSQYKISASLHHLTKALRPLWDSICVLENAGELTENVISKHLAIAYAMQRCTVPRPTQLPVRI